MKTLKIYLSVILLFSIFNVFGQVQQDGSITIQKLCEDCDTIGDEDGDGNADCEDVECILKLYNSEFKSDFSKNSTLECPPYEEDFLEFLNLYCLDIVTNTSPVEEVPVDEISNAASMEPKWGQLGTCQEIIEEIELVQSELSGKTIKEQVDILQELFNCQAMYKRPDEGPQAGMLIYDEGRKDHCLTKKYMYTTEYGWIDFHHFFLIYLWAIEALEEAEEDPYWRDNLYLAAGRAEALGWEGEMFQLLKDIYSENNSAFSYEDLCSNHLGAMFFVHSFQDIEAGTLSWSDAINNMCGSVGATIPELAPNYSFIPHIHNEFYPKEFLKQDCLKGEDLSAEAATQFCKRPVSEQQNIYEAHIKFPH